MKKGKRGSAAPSRRPARGPQLTETQTEYPFHAVVAYTLSGGVLAVPIRPDASGIAIPRLTTAADVWALWRMKRFRFRLLCNTQSTAVDSVVGYYGKAPATTAPATVQTITELGKFSLVTTKQTSHGQWVRVPKSLMMGQMPFYQTQGGSTGADVAEEDCGTMYLFGSSTGPLSVEISGTILFKSPVDGTNTPLSLPAAMRALAVAQQELELAQKCHDAVVEKERQRLLRILGVDEAKPLLEAANTARAWLAEKGRISAGVTLTPTQWIPHPPPSQ